MEKSVLLIPSPHEEREKERSFCEDRKLPSRKGKDFKSPYEGDLGGLFFLIKWRRAFFICYFGINQKFY
jgi:hypothetical protein